MREKKHNFYLFLFLSIHTQGRLGIEQESQSNKLKFYNLK